MIGMSTASDAIHAFASSRTAKALETTGELMSLAWQSTEAAVVDIVRRQFSWNEFFLQTWFMVRVSLLPTLLVAIPFGVIVSVQVGGIADQIGATSFLGAVNGTGVLQQGAPLVTSLMISGVVGAAITADLGARKVREEIDALMVMGISPVRRLVAPRLVAALFVSFLLTIVVATAAVLAGFALAVGRGQVSAGTYIGSFVQFAPKSALYLAEFKALVFGFLATIVAAHKGLSANGGPKGVANAVNQSVVLSVIVLAIANVAITQADSMLFPQRLG